jgi:hypothetical protein
MLFFFSFGGFCFAKRGEADCLMRNPDFFSDLYGQGHLATGRYGG